MAKSWLGWGMVVGAALGGFFDGILLHQILQWHHLLSLVPGIDDLRTQILWDGYFHALMYGIAVVGLWGLWRAQRAGKGGSGRELGAALLFGCGVWNVLDVVLFHWIMGIHRIRVDSANPLFWDVLWLVLFGLVPLAAGWLLLRRRRDADNQGDGSQKDGPRRSGPGAVALAITTVGVLGAAAWSLRPPPEQPFTTVVFAPGVEPARVIAALDSIDGRLVWSDPGMGVVVVDTPASSTWSLYAKGALLVSDWGVPAACVNWSRV